MTGFWILWRKELTTSFLSPIAYAVMVFFLVVFGFSFWLLVHVLVQGAGGAAVMKEFFGSIFFWIALLVVVPLLTMRLFAEEKRAGTLETLMTAPVTDTAIVLAKYAAALSAYVLVWAPTAIYALILRAFSSLSAPVDLGPMFSGYLGAFLVGAFYLAIGLLCSSLTSNQIVAAISCFAIIGMMFFAGFLTFLARTDAVREVVGYASSVMHMLEFSRGLVDSRPIVFYLSSSAFVLFATVKVIESRRWR